MKNLCHLASLVVGLVLLMHVTPSWGQLVNPVVSDQFGNTAGGTNALHNLVPGGLGGNTAFGDGALFHTSTGIANTAIGNAALDSNTTGSYNTACGEGALPSNTTGSRNTASGMSALFFNTTGEFNTAIGNNALQGNDTGVKNTAVGAKALLLSTGNKNIAIGFQAGKTLTIGNNNIYIGNQGAGDESQTIRIGTAQTQTFLAGINTAGVSGTAVVVDANGQLGITLSSARYKRDIAPMGSESEKVLDLRPVTFAYKQDAQYVKHYGLVAEEVAAVYPELVTRTATGEVQTVKYQELIPMLLNELQHQQRTIQRLERELMDLRAVVGQGRETASLPR